MTNASHIWEAALGELQIQVNRTNYQTWLKDTVGIDNQEHLFTVGVASPFAAEWLEKRLKSLVQKTLIGILGHDVEVQFKVTTGKVETLSSMPPAASKENGCVPRQAFSCATPLLRPCYTFDNFVVGASNCLAYAAALKVAESPGSTYNPLFIYGDSGLGKTHLLHAIGHAAVGNNLHPLYVSAEQFTNQYLYSIRERNTEDFRARYRGAELLLIDDIQFLKGKEQTQEGFFHTFNDLHLANRQIVITSDRPPGEIPLLEDRLRSRLEWGLVADIQAPDQETRLAILKSRVKQQKLEVSQDVLELIARRVQQNIRGLEGALNRVMAYARMSESPPTLQTVAKALAEAPHREETNHRLPPEQIVQTVAEYFNMPLDALKGKKRDQRTALARQIAMYLIREEAHLPLVAIGQQMGRDHSTVLHGCEKIVYDLNTNPRLRQQVQDIKDRLRQPRRQA